MSKLQSGNLSETQRCWIGKLAKLKGAVHVIFSVKEQQIAANRRASMPAIA